MSDDELIDVDGLDENEDNAENNYMQLRLRTVDELYKQVAELIQRVEKLEGENSNLVNLVEELKSTIKNFHVKERLRLSHEARSLKPIEQMGYNGREQRIKKVKEIIVRLAGDKASDESVRFLMRELSDEFNINKAGKLSNYESLAIKLQLHLSDSNYHSVLRNPRYDLPFATLYSVQQAAKLIRESSSYSSKKVITRVSMNEFSIIYSANSAIELIKKHIILLKGSNCYQARSENDNLIEVILDGDKGSSSTKICLRIMNTTLKKNSVWNVIPLVAYDGPDKREFVSAAAQNYFDETAIKEIIIDEKTYELRWKLGGDLLFICEMLGLDNARDEPCIYCHIHKSRKSLSINDYPPGQAELRSLDELFEQGKEAEDNMVAKRAKMIEKEKDPSLVKNVHVHGVLGVPLVSVSLNDVIPAPMHSLTGLVTLLFCEIEKQCPDAKDRIKRQLLSMGINSDYKIGSFTGVHGLKLIRNSQKLAEVLTDDEKKLVQSVLVAMELLADLHYVMKSGDSDDFDKMKFRADVHTFITHVRKNLSTLNYTNKLHLLEYHLPDVVDYIGQLGDWSEQATEAIHFQVELRKRDWKQKRGKSVSDFELDRLMYSLNVQYEFVQLYHRNLLI